VNTITYFGLLWADPEQDQLSKVLIAQKPTESTLGRNLSIVPLMHLQPSFLGSLILTWIIPAENTP